MQESLGEHGSTYANMRAVLSTLAHVHYHAAIHHAYQQALASDTAVRIPGGLSKEEERSFMLAAVTPAAKMEAERCAYPPPLAPARRLPLPSVLPWRRLRRCLRTAHWHDTRTRVLY